jgi:hypothetical protein
LAVLSVAVPSAVVVLTPRTEAQQARLHVRLDPQASEIGSDGSIPASQLVRVVSGELRLPTTGLADVATSFAAGVVEMENLGDTPLVIPAGTSLRPASRQDLYFRTRSEIALGPGETGPVEIVASQPGPIGNVPAESINSVDGPLGLSVAVSNPRATTGGAETRRASPTPQDRVRLYQRLALDLVNRAQHEWLEALPEGTVLHPESVAVDEVVTEEYSVEIGAAADSHALTLELRVIGLAYLEEHLEALAHNDLERRRPEGWTAVPDSLRIDPLPVSPTPSPRDPITLEVSVQETIYVEVDRRALASRLAGSAPAMAAQAVRQEAELAQDPSIQLSPSWWPWMPFLPVQIQVVWVWQAR